uniref:Uncharacterized protein n=1 Tax=Pyxicephalus adspersus TaxID=30357 RepID=A0AAV3AQY8_PYXAD|nr:TPA: hypothetical protein GDO54_001465 [Pyxicephalus adspersus]
MKNYFVTINKSEKTIIHKNKNTLKKITIIVALVYSVYFWIQSLTKYQLKTFDFLAYLLRASESHWDNPRKQPWSWQFQKGDNNGRLTIFSVTGFHCFF